MIELIGVPYDLWGCKPGSRLGPEVLRLSGLLETLKSLGEEVSDSGDLKPFENASTGQTLRHFNSYTASVSLLKNAVSGACQKGHIPLVMGGDHSLSAGSVAGAQAAYPGELAVLWIDAHADVNTPATSSSGNLHGMPLAALLGEKSLGESEQEWLDLCAITASPQPLQPNRIAWFGLRDVDEGEKKRIQGLEGCLAITMHDIDRNGVTSQMELFSEWLLQSGATRLWISFDVDVLDPGFAPGTGTPVRGGLTYREAHVCAELLREILTQPGAAKLAGLDIVETNPLTDRYNETGTMAVEWAASLFGKTILGTK